MSDPAGRTATIDGIGPEPPKDQAPTRPRGRRRRWLIAVVTALALVAALLAGGGAYWSSVELPTMVPLPSSTTLYYADGETVLARLGNADRTELDYAEILPAVVDVAVAAQDPQYWSNAAGPITRATVRLAFDIVGTGNNARLRVWVLAHKLESAYSKEEILRWYLNAVPFGRGTFGIEAAARAYFGKSASTTAPPEEQLTAAEAMVLLAIVDQPYPDAENPQEFPGFDPAFSEAAEANSRERWAEIRDSLADQVREGRATSVSSEEVSALSYPMPQPATDGLRGLDRPVGLVANHILSALTHTPGSHFEGWPWDGIRGGGYEIITTIDPRAQQALEAAADATIAGSLMDGQPEHMQAAGVVVEPVTGRVLAYFGGSDGLGSDYAGVHRGEDGVLVGFGAHPPGASFMVYPLAAALEAGYSLNSQWQWTPHDQAGRSPENPVRNDARCESNPNGQTCSLLDSVTYSLNVPLYDVTASVTPVAVVELARDAGITALWNDNREYVNLFDFDPVASGIGLEVGLGQYPVTVLDQAAAMATFAGGGVPAKAHFVREVRKGDQLLYGEQLPAAGGERVLTDGQLADLTYALTRASGRDDLAIKTGAWEFAGNVGLNSNVWSVGFTSALATAIWVGNRADERALVDKDGQAVWGAGLPTQILQRVIDTSQAELGLSPQPFPPPVFGGTMSPTG